MTDNIDAEKEIIVKINNAMTPMDCDIPDDIELEEAVFWANYLGNMYKQSMWALGALLAKSEQKFGEKYSHIRKATGLDYGTIANVKSVYLKVQISRRREKLSFSHHQAVASLEPFYQEQFLVKAENEKLNVKQLREVIKISRRAKKETPVRRETFEILYSMPPFSKGLKILCEMPIGEIATDNAVLILYVHRELVEDSIKIINAWGFDYKIHFVLERANAVQGDWGMIKHHVLMVATKGTIQAPAPGNCPPSIINLSIQEESGKEDYVYNFIEKMFPDMTRIQLFGECDRPGWKSWNNG